MFYQHFGDRDDAVAYAFTVAFASATADIARRSGRPHRGAVRFRRRPSRDVPQHRAQRGNAACRRRLPRRTRPACEEIAAEGMPTVATVASLTPESVSRFLVGGFMEVLRSWMEDPDATDLRGRVTGALDTVGALLGLTAATGNH